MNGSRRSSRRAADEPSDVRRLDGLLPGSIAFALALGAALYWSEGQAALSSPGALSRPHARAGVGCADCHGQGEIVAACVRCHGPHATTRRGHARVRQLGKMTCVSCHDSHRSDQGVALGTEGRAWRYGNGWSVPAETPPLFHAPKSVFVATVAAERCGACHALDDPADAIVSCLPAGGTRGRANVPTLCFDEHTRPGLFAESAKRGARDGAWEAARQVLVSTPAPAAPTRLPWLALSFGLGLVVWGGRRWQLGAGLRGKKVEVDVAPTATRRLPQVDSTTCLGCRACVDACPYGVIEMETFLAKVARPDDCCGLTLCEQKCPNGSLVVREGPAIVDRPRVDENLQSLDVPGLFLAGDLTGMPLIKNAINQGDHALKAIAGALPKRRRGARGTDADVIVVGAGPAGLSAALAAQREGLSAIVLEQATVAASIRSFPRGKLVFDQPLDVPVVGELWLEESTKEELLAQWLRIVRRHALPIRERTRVLAVERVGEAGFRVDALDEDDNSITLRAPFVVMAVGKRGTPRRLDATIDADAESRVFYGISDAASFAGMRVLVVGLGDSAMETALALSLQADTRVTVVHRGSDFARGKPRNISALREAADAGRVSLSFDTVVTHVHAGGVELECRGKRSTLSVDAIVVQIGALTPWAFLERAGIQRPVPELLDAKGEPSDEQH
ncbi:MAG: NAD(P)-binding domain-containing protein [Polyangiaceae bacterium]